MYLIIGRDSFCDHKEQENAIVTIGFKKLIAQNNVVEFLILEGWYFKIEIFFKIWFAWW